MNVRFQQLNRIVETALILKRQANSDAIMFMHTDLELLRAIHRQTAKIVFFQYIETRSEQQPSISREALVLKNKISPCFPLLK